MKILISTVFSLFIFISAIAQQPSVSIIKNLKNGNIINDYSHIYRLPFELGFKARVIQAAYSNLSHKNEIALDFKLKSGTIICAARDGVVVAAYGESNRGGIGNKYMNDGNHIIIEHLDKSRALYWHLQYNGVLINIGDTVKVGQTIGLSGNTGYSAFPHLHFEINAFTPDGIYAQVPARFYTNKGIKYLRPLKKYKTVM